MPSLDQNPRRVLEYKNEIGLGMNDTVQADVDVFVFLCSFDNNISLIFVMVFRWCRVLSRPREENVSTNRADVQLLVPFIDSRLPLSGSYRIWYTLRSSEISGIDAKYVAYLLSLEMEVYPDFLGSGAITEPPFCI